jgi:SAM-dependent methyltransferase
MRDYLGKAVSFLRAMLRAPKQTCRPHRNACRQFLERCFWGGATREKALLFLLGGYYRSRFRRQWRLRKNPPHFEDQRIFMFDFVFGHQPPGPYPFYRAFFSSEVIQEGDTLLDIGCGDGFLTRRFLAEKCSKIDAVDCDPEAILAGQRYNAAPNVAYHVLDAAKDPFPQRTYDVIVADASLGYFKPEDIAPLLAKIAGSLSPDGAFVGSVSLGKVGGDPLRHFESLEEVAALLRPHFSHIQCRVVEYRLAWANGFRKKAAYWRCFKGERRAAGVSWQRMEQQGRVHEFTSDQGTG